MLWGGRGGGVGGECVCVHVFNVCVCVRTRVCETVVDAVVFEGRGIQTTFIANICGQEHASDSCVFCLFAFSFILSSLENTQY